MSRCGILCLVRSDEKGNDDLGFGGQEEVFQAATGRSVRPQLCGNGSGNTRRENLPCGWGKMEGRWREKGPPYPIAASETAERRSLDPSRTLRESLAPSGL